MKLRRKKDLRFPMDFYGESGQWRFAIRAESSEQVIDAKKWLAAITCNRHRFDLYSIANAMFQYQQSHRPDESSSTPILIKASGPVVTVTALEQTYSNC
uniref:hypothetical protein n=1 Tax=Thaumasiovibrio occultus TaxID=1891184 RepID=UPI000B34EAB8|nr:hypothetical protein [Thaumasiovibrio occultus]